MLLSRRAVLAGSSAALVGLSGCEAGEGTGPAGSPSSTDDEPPTETPGLDSLTFDATVVRQQSVASPATVGARLTNTGRRPIRFVTGPTIVPRNVDGRRLTVLLYPHTYVGPNRTPREPTEGCWRYVDDGLLVQDSLEQRAVAAGDSFSETYSLYTVGGAGPCLPAGEYRFEDEVLSADESRRLTVWVDLTVTAEGEVSTVAGTAESATSAELRR